jgi:hypothetical protein
MAAAIVVLAAPGAHAAIKVHPVGVNVSSQGASTVFLTYGGLRNQVPAEAFWCGELVPAAPDLGSKCDPATIFGSLPLRYNQSRTSGSGGFTDIMSIPASVTRRAYQAARAGRTSSFFYVRRFVSTVGGRDEYVAVTCRMSGGGARTALSLLDVRLAFAGGAPVAYVGRGDAPPAFEAGITYNGTGRLKGRWEVVAPGDELPSPQDLLTEASLPIEARGQQRRYAQIERFNVYVPPTGRATLPGPSVARLPTHAAGTYLILLRIEASDDKEADSDLTKAGAGPGIVHSGGVAGFPMPVLRYIVGGAPADGAQRAEDLQLLLPLDAAELAADQPLDFTWLETTQGAVYRVEIDDRQQVVHAALVPAGTGIYRAPPWLHERAGGKPLRWRVVALDVQGAEVRISAWRGLRLRP